MVRRAGGAQDGRMTSDTPQDSQVWPPTPAPAHGPGPVSFPTAAPHTPQDATSAVGDRVWTILSNTKRRGDWVVPERLVLPVAMGDVYIDLRQARLTAQTTTIEVQGLMGEVKIVVPDTVRVECSGSAIMGEFHDVPSVSPAPSGLSGAVVRVVGAMIMGQVRVFRTAEPVGEAGYSIDGLAGWRAQRRRHRTRRAITD
jgi:hypothetical protein